METPPAAERTRSRIRVEGIVQGVGFRPFVHALATRYGLAGLVGNDAGGVFIEVEGAPAAVAALVAAVRERPPALAVIGRISVTPVPPSGAEGFRIVPSLADGPGRAIVPPDAATCDDCLAELFDPADRRYRYPFVNCTNCGPRFTIVTGVPYDRIATTMAGFPMCRDCAREYRDPDDRRFHAQPICCPACGPTPALRAPDGAPIPDEPLLAAAAWLRQGAVLAVKGLGGYHLAVDAANETAVARLRAGKRRSDKAFAVMVADLAAARELCELDSAAAALLTGPRRPIVLARRRTGPDRAAALPTVPRGSSGRRDAIASPAPSVAPGNRDLGVMLPYTPLHHLLARELGRPFVLTSGNLSDEPIVCDDGEALRRLSGVADAVLAHDRPIHAPADDSVVRLFRGAELSVRRARGYAPEPLTIPWEFSRPVLACGAEVKSTFCLGLGRQAIVSPHIGDLSAYETWQAYLAMIEHFRRLFDVEPVVVAHDLHPGYRSTEYALSLDGVEPVGVQHHHAHIAACLAEHGEAGPVVGVAFDGTGYGPDGTVWGGELLVADLAGFERAGHLERVPMPGGAAAIRRPWRMAAAHLHAALGPDGVDDLDVVRRNGAAWRPVAALVAAAASGTAPAGAAPATSSAGRLFDAVSALLGIRDAVTYEGQAAVELEQCADPGTRDGYPVTVQDGTPAVIRASDLIRAVVHDLRRGEAPPVIAARFHHGLAAAVVTAATRIARATGIGVVALSGGVFGNHLLLGDVVDGLSRQGLRVLVHRRMPCNDGGISLGQAVVAAARDRTRQGAGGGPA